MRGRRIAGSAALKSHENATKDLRPYAKVADAPIVRGTPLSWKAAQVWGLSAFDFSDGSLYIAHLLVSAS